MRSNVSQAYVQPHHVESPTYTNFRWRLFWLCLLLGLAVLCNWLIVWSAPVADGPVIPFLPLWLVSFVPYLAACLVVLTMRTGGRREQWIEVGIILVGGLLLRAMIVQIEPNLSRDSWRYLWDARVTLEGYSPYVYEPGHPMLQQFRDFLFDNSRYRNVPTLYPPGAQAVYLLSYVIAPGNLIVLKGIFIVFELVTCLALALLLERPGLDPARCVLYAWCPLPIIEFAIQGHVDVVTITLMVLTVLCAESSWRGSRAMTGFLLGWATLTKYYPIILLVAIIRRRDWLLLTTCFGTILLAYVPYFILGKGQILGFLGVYTSEYTPNASIILHAMHWIGSVVGGSRQLIMLATYVVDLALVGGISLFVLRLRLAGKMRIEAAVLLLISTVFFVSSHVFSWYVAALLPWIALLIGSLWTKKEGLRRVELAVVLAWYFTAASIVSYFFAHIADWSWYYVLSYDVVLAGLLLIGVVTVARGRRPQGKEIA